MRSKKTGKMMLLMLTLAASVVFTACGAEKSVESEIFKKMDTVDMEGNKADASLFAENTITLVNLWNVGCTPCIDELPALDKLNKEYEGEGAAIKGLYFSAGSTLTDEESEEINSILEKSGAQYQQLTLSEDMLNDDVIKNIQAFPTTFVVDAEGNIVNKIEGSNDYEGWKKVIDKELKKAKENAEK